MAGQIKRGQTRRRSSGSVRKAPKAAPQLPRLENFPLKFAGSSIQIGSKQLGRKGSITLIVCVCLVATSLFLYTPVKNYYFAVRDQAKAEIAYEIVSKRNDALIEDVALLTSEAGMEDRARQQYGWVKQGENAVTVTGLSNEGDPSAAEVLRTVTLNDVRAPETWYSPLLDSVFGYQA